MRKAKIADAQAAKKYHQALPAQLEQALKAIRRPVRRTPAPRARGLRASPTELGTGLLPV